MSSQIPLRSIRIPALQRQCLFQRHQTLHRSAQPAITYPSSRRTFASTPSRLKKQSILGHNEAVAIAFAESQIAKSESPKLTFERAQTDADSMAEDIGILQNTIVRAPFRALMKEANGIKGVAAYYWNLIKHKGTGLYSRYYYRACIQKSGWTKYLPVDIFNNSQYKAIAKKHYEQIQKNFASGNTAPLEQICLSPLVKKLNQRIATRGPLQMSWQLHKFKSARVVSHRCAPLGEDQPDSAYRQVVVRIESVQSLKRFMPSSSSLAKSVKSLPWVPDAARQRVEKARQRRRKLEDEGEVEEVKKQVVKNSGERFHDNGVPKTVVEYLVLQKRVIRGSEEDWKVWGFAEESVPSVVARDERYWSSMLNSQVGSA